MVRRSFTLKEHFLDVRNAHKVHFRVDARLEHCVLCSLCFDLSKRLFSAFFSWISLPSNIFPKGMQHYQMAVFSEKVQGIELDVSKTKRMFLLQKILFTIIMQICSNLEMVFFIHVSKSCSCSTESKLF